MEAYDPATQVAAPAPPDTRASRPTDLIALELLLRSVRPVTDAENDDAIDGILASGYVDWDRVGRLARAHGVLPLLYRTLRTREQRLVPEAQLAALQQDFHRMSMLVHLQTSALCRLLDALDERNISSLILKGIPLGRLAYGNPIWRKPGDIDLLIQPQAYPVVCEVLNAMGLRAELTGEEADQELRWKKQMTFRGEPSDVDVHLSLEQSSFLRIAYSSGVDDQQFWARSRWVSVGDRDVRALGPEDLFCFLCIHSAKHAWYLLFMTLDLAAYVANNPIDWNRVSELARTLRAERFVAISLLLAHRLCGLELPAPWAGLVDDRNLGALVDRIAGRMFDDRAPNHPIAFHLLQARILPGAIEKGRYLVNVCIEHVRRKRRADA
ncbi:MAG: nucleotidyltransferase family protein [Rhodothermales bacterium]